MNDRSSAYDLYFLALAIGCGVGAAYIECAGLVNRPHGLFIGLAVFTVGYLSLLWLEKRDAS